MQPMHYGPENIPREYPRGAGINSSLRAMGFIFSGCPTLFWSRWNLSEIPIVPDEHPHELH